MSQSISLTPYGIVAPQLLGAGAAVSIAAPAAQAPAAIPTRAPAAQAPAPPSGVGPYEEDPSLSGMGAEQMMAAGMLPGLTPGVVDGIPVSAFANPSDTSANPAAVLNGLRSSNEAGLESAENGLQQALVATGAYPGDDGGAQAATRNALMVERAKFLDSTRQTVNAYNRQYLDNSPLGANQVRAPINDSYREIMSFFSAATAEPVL